MKKIFFLILLLIGYTTYASEISIEQPAQLSTGGAMVNFIKNNYAPVTGVEQADDLQYSKNNDIYSSRYYAEISKKIEDKLYSLTPIIKKGKSVATIKINRQGKLLSVKINKSFGNEQIDKLLIKAIEKSSPFPSVPDEFEGEYIEFNYEIFYSAFWKY